MSLPIYAVYGAGGCGRGILPLVRTMLKENNASLDRLIFIDDDVSFSKLNGHSVMSYKQFLDLDASKKYVAIAIASGYIREKLFNRLLNDGINVLSIFANNIMVMDDVKVGEGALLSPFVCLTSNIIVGKCFHANLYSYVEHDCIIGDFVTFAPGVKCNGNVMIEDYAYIGSGAIIKQGNINNPIVIGRGAVVGMGAIVTKDVAPDITVVGNPARPV